MNNNKHVPLIMGTMAIVVGVFMAMWGGVIGFILAAFLLLFGWNSLKTVVYGSDKKIQ